MSKAHAKGLIKSKNALVSNNPNPNPSSVSTPALNALGLESVDVIGLADTQITFNDFRALVLQIRPSPIPDDHILLPVYKKYTQLAVERARLVNKPIDDHSDPAQLHPLPQSFLDMAGVLFYWKVAKRPKKKRGSEDKVVEPISVGAAYGLGSALHLNLGQTVATPAQKVKALTRDQKKDQNKTPAKEKTEVKTKPRHRSR